METEKTEYFDLPSLLKHGDLDIRRFADTYTASADEYFNMLSKFIKHSSVVKIALSKFADLDLDKDAYKNLEEMIILLKGLGSDMFISDFYAILGAYDTGNWRLAGYHAGKILDDFSGFQLRIEEAKRKNKPKSLPDTTLALKEYIRCLDEEESNRKMIILAIDDSPVVLKTLSSLLGEEYKVYTLPKPTELETVLQKLTPDLFLLDYQMPEINGFDLIPIIRSFEDHKDTPVVFLTSQRSIDNVTAALALGASDFIAKPFNPDVLREKIKKYIVRKKSF